MIIVVQFLVEWFQQHHVVAIPLSILLNIGMSVMGVIPSLILTTTNLIVWGPLWGGLFSWLGEVFGAWVAFELYRRGIQRFTSNHTVSWRWIQHINRWSRNRQFFALLIVRLFPFVPSGAINALAAFTNVKSQDFFLATMLGKVPAMSLEVLISYDLLHFQENYVRLTIVLVLLLGSFLLHRYTQQRGEDGSRSRKKVSVGLQEKKYNEVRREKE